MRAKLEIPQSATRDARGRELTCRAFLLGLILSIVMGAANVYLGLRVGMTVSASIPAAVIATLLFRTILRHGTILEANQVQTAASAGESLAAGIIFTLPALVMIGVWHRFDMLLTPLIAFAGGLLGVLLMIPMRRVFIKPQDDTLKFPEGLACAAVLSAGEGKTAGAGGSIMLLSGALFGSLVKLLVSFFGLARNTLEGAAFLGNRLFYFGADISVALFGVGVIVGREIAFLLFLGGAAGWLIALPLLSSAGEPGASPTDLAYAIWSRDVRYMGVGAMAVGGISAIIRVRQGLLAALRYLSAPYASAVPDHDDRDLPLRWLAPLALGAVLSIAAVYRIVIGEWHAALGATVFMLCLGFFFTAVASYVVGLVGNSNSPVSGMTITAVLVTSLWLLAMGFTGTPGMAAALGVAAVVCCTACTAGDICNDLKTGQLVGATPWRQQAMQVAGVAVAALVMAPVLQLLQETTPGGIGGRELAAPQAQLFASLVQGLFGAGPLPWSMVGFGVALGLGVLSVDRALQRRRMPLRLHLMPVAVGMYLPFGLTVPILAGGVMAHLLERSGTRKGAVSRSVLLASGAIAGEALTGILIAVLVACGVTRYAPALPGWLLDATTVGIILLAFVLFYRGPAAPPSDPPDA